MIVRRRFLLRNFLLLILSLLTVYELHDFFGNTMPTRMATVTIETTQRTAHGYDQINRHRLRGNTPPMLDRSVIYKKPKHYQDREKTFTVEIVDPPHHVLLKNGRNHNNPPQNTLIDNNPMKYRKLLDESEGRKHYKMFVGILSAKRDPPTVVGMAEELVRHVTHKDDYKFATWISHSAANEYHVINQLKELGFEVYISNGTYPELRPEKIRITHNDSLERVKWRTTHVLDYANLLERSLSYDAEFVLILEDDLKPAKHALDKSYYAASEQLRAYKDWAILTLFGKRYRKTPFKVVTRNGTFGTCTMLFKRDIASGVIDYIRQNALEDPVDILLPRYFDTLKSGQIYERTPNLFQHISLHSSFKLQDKERRGTERGRSITFLYDEDNDTLASIPAKPDGYIGCFVDQPGPTRRDLSGLYAYLTDKRKDRRPSPTHCRKYCGRYRYYGLQNGGDCYCGNEFGQYGWASENECNQPCSANKNIMCGGKYRNSVYRV